MRSLILKLENLVVVSIDKSKVECYMCPYRQLSVCYLSGKSQLVEWSRINLYHKLSGR